MSSEFYNFLEETDSQYRQQLVKLPLFDITHTATWEDSQKKAFAAVFYHIRGHFVNFMWYVANFADDLRIKKIIFENIQEELGIDNRISHEKLYVRFAEVCGVDVQHEIAYESNYLPFARKFNQTHLQWLTEHSLQEQFATFAAYEKLDNTDYPYLTALAQSLAIPNDALTFFKVHERVNHFDVTTEILKEIWIADAEKVKKSFNFIYSHQLNMWQELSNMLC
ncbi:MULTISPECIES: iron-containing redox enzyme family protein [Legionella]|uniref:iron-containing redox enzyme family protein n=1 Tax=Legionella TaxID=445 RepID=UPI001F314053|nr:iron-containing redox enzyme family protein [Legionella septentrionalis]MCP0913477.1 iron-containing redox enzyme family protein [Legionella sp. 27cVA30]